jgi:ferredoxin
MYSFISFSMIIIFVLMLQMSIISGFSGVFRGQNSAGRYHSFHSSALSAKRNWQPSPEDNDINDALLDNINGISFDVELPRRAGIDWGTDLSFRWVYVVGLDPGGEAAKSGRVQLGDYIIGLNNISTVASDFDFVLSTLTQQKEDRFNYTFFRGAKEQLMGGPVPEPSDLSCIVTVIQNGKPDLMLRCPGGTNLRQLLVSNGINVYRSITRWTNCNGNQRCGTCIVDIKDGMDRCSRKALDEEAVLRENPEGYRLSCITSVYGDVTVEVQGRVGAAQWTR